MLFLWFPAGGTRRAAKGRGTCNVEQTSTDFVRDSAPEYIFTIRTGMRSIPVSVALPKFQRFVALAVEAPKEITTASACNRVPHSSRSHALAVEAGGTKGTSGALPQRDGTSVGSFRMAGLEPTTFCTQSK